MAAVLLPSPSTITTSHEVNRRYDSGVGRAEIGITVGGVHRSPAHKRVTSFALGMNACEGRECSPSMSRKTLLSMLVMIVSALLAVALFIAGAIWRGRNVTQQRLENGVNPAGTAPSVPVQSGPCSFGQVANSQLLLCALRVDSDPRVGQK